MRRLLVIALAACAAFAASPQHASAGTCGISGKGTLWIDFADGSVPFWQTFARPGVIAAASNFIYPPQLRALGAKTIYWDMSLSRRVGSPLEPFDPGLVIQRANRLYDVASTSSDCAQPMIAENELQSANAVTPWSATNAQYRRNMMIFVQTLTARGARPVILVPSTPYIGDTAGDWWRQLSTYADIVRESYFAAPMIAKDGPQAGSRELRMFFRRKVAEFTAAGISPRKLGLMLGFQTTPGDGGRERASRLGGFAGYRAALSKAHASPAAARGVIADELRRAKIESRLRVASPSAADVKEYYVSYGDTRARLVEAKARAPWLGNGKRGFALASHAPPQLFTIPQGPWVKVQSMLGSYKVRALGPAVPLGTVPIELARGAIVNALKSLARDERYESWLLARERVLVGQSICRRDVQPAIGVVPLTD